MEVHEQRRAFRTLDGLRGTAALLVVTRHLGVMGLTLPNSFLAVDLFFALSGYVIAFAYDGRIAQGGFLGRFLVIRLIRLYPLFLLGLGIGAIAHFGGRIGLAPGPLAEAIVIGALMIPAIPLLPFSVSSLVGPAWTLPLELFANMVYAAAFRWMGVRTLALIVALSAAAVVWCAHDRGQLDLGWSFHDLPVALARLFFSFFAGVLMFRLNRGRGGERPLTAWACLLALAVLLLAPVPVAVRLPYQVALILIAFPAVVWTASRCEPAPGSGRLFRFTGLISYAVYTIHQPLGTLTVRIVDHLVTVDWAHWHRLTTVLFVAAMVPLCWAADEFYDAPVRRWLAARLLKRG